LFRKLWRRVILPSVDRWVAISKYVQGKLLAAGADPQAVRVIHNYPPERRRATPTTALGGSAGATRGDEGLADVARRQSDGCTIVYMGQLTKEKGVHLLVDAALRLCQEREDVHFLLAGDYSWQNPFAEHLIKRVEAAGLATRIRFLGYVDDVPALLDLADIHCAPSVWEEPLGNVILEAKRASVPSVVFPSGGLPEMVVEHGTDGFICRGKSVEALLEGLHHYLDLPANDLVNVKEAAGASLARLGITREAFIQKWLAVYRDEEAVAPAPETVSESAS
jgi:glycosyltransferase involved in cell wall biosynthesis